MLIFLIVVQNFEKILVPGYKGVDANSKNMESDESSELNASELGTKE